MMINLLKSNVLFFYVLIILSITGCQNPNVRDTQSSFEIIPLPATSMSDETERLKGSSGGVSRKTSKSKNRTCWNTVDNGKVFILAMGANTGKLKKTDRDAKTFLKTMRGLFNVKKNSCLLDNVYRKEFINAINGLNHRVNGEDLVIIYFSGHGAKTTDKNGDERDGCDESFATHGGALKDDDFAKLVEAIPTRNILMVIDACFSASLTKKEEPEEIEQRSKYYPNSCKSKDGIVYSHVGRLDQPKKGVLLSAATEGQNAIELEGQGGRFTISLLKVLKSAIKNNHRNINWLNVFEKTRERVLQESKNQQEPVKLGDMKILKRIKNYIP
jgi:hypothetical protein